MAPSLRNASSQLHVPPVRPHNIDPAPSVLGHASNQGCSNHCVWEWERFMKRAIDPIRSPARKLQWSVSDLKGLFHGANWTLSSHTLDLATGRASNGQHFLKPCSPQEIESWLKDAQPWRATHPYSPAEDFVTRFKTPLCVKRYDNARSMWACMFSHLESHIDRHKHGILPTFTCWSGSRTANRKLRHYGKWTKWNWETMSVFYRLLKPAAEVNWWKDEDVTDISAPHALAVIASERPIFPKKICGSEIAALVYLANDIVHDAAYYQHKIIPITVVNISGNLVRITQGCFDLKDRKLDIHVAPIIDFSSTPLTVDEKRVEFFQLLGWFTSKHTGTTV